MELAQLSNAVVAIESYGVHPSTIGVLQATGLLNGTALESIGLESFTVSKPGDAEANLALEALGEKIKEKSAAWAAKIVSVVKGGTEKLLGMLKAVWNKVTAGAKAAAGGIKSTVSAHPYATVAGAVAAIVAVAGVVAFATDKFPAKGGKPEAFKKFTESLGDRLGKIKWPLGKVEHSVSDDGMKLLVNYTPSSSTALMVVDQPAEKLGWTKAGVTALTGQLNRAWTSISGALGKFATKATSFATGVKEFAKDSGKAWNSVALATDAAGRAHMQSELESGKSIGRAYAGVLGGAVLFYAQITAISLIIYKLCKWVVKGALNLVAKTFRAIAGKSAEAAA